jgi:arsenate reductase (glutaredoxin)
VRRDYFKERFTVEELRALLGEIGLTPRDALSRRSRSYKARVSDRLDSLIDDELLRLMVEDPTLLRRPLAVRDGQAVVGFDRAGLTELAGE